jgi:K(+)-stimulated pyrophosphate-energized sodium pump
MFTEPINHDPAITFFQTGHQNPGRPSFGAWTLYGLGSANRDLPGFVVMVSKDVARTSRTGAATVILAGIGVGFESAVYTAVIIGAAVYGAFLLGGGSVSLALFFVAVAGTGLLTTVGVIVAMDTFGPISDNAQGIAEMSGDIDAEGAQILTDLDAVGNTTKAITKGIAIATAVLAATALFGSYTDSIYAVLNDAGDAAFNADALVFDPSTLVGLIIGAAVVFMFSGLAINAVGAGGVNGRGEAGATQTNLNFLPEHATDFAFASLAEQRGFVGVSVLLLLYLLVVWRGLKVIAIARDAFSAIAAGGIVFAFLFQVFVNVGMNIGVAPVTGIPLPFVSVGGSALIANLLAMGVLQAIHVRGASVPKAYR